MPPSNASPAACYALKRPIKVTLTPAGGEARTEEVTALTFREPLAEDLAVMDRHTGATMKTMELMAHLSGVPLAAIKKMTAPDFAGAAEALGPLLGDGPATGATS